MPRRAGVSLRRLARGNQVVEFVLIVAIALALAFGLQAFVVKPYQIPSGSMEPTLAIGQRVLVDRIGNDFFAPSVGDIVVFHPPAGAPAQICGDTHEKPGQACARPTARESNQNYIKRVVAGPGDTIKIIAGHVWLQREAPEGAVRELRRLHADQRRLQLPDTDHDSGRLLLHDGRQP